MDELKPCAHCEHFAIDAGKIDKQGTFEICCSYCGSMMRGMDYAQLVEDWNRRPAPENKPIDGIELAKIAMALQQLKAENTALKAKFDEVNRYNISCTKEIDRLLSEKVAPENKPLTNLEVLFGTPEKIADILLPMLPTMEGFCPYCTHWIDGVCKVNPHWDCKNALVNWLNSPLAKKEK